LDDNGQTKSDKKDALTIARLVKDGRYSEAYLPHDVYADLRVLSTARNSVNQQKNALENTILAVMDEYFPEFTKVFKYPFKGKAAMQIMKTCPFPKYILELGVNGVTAEMKKAAKRAVGQKRAQQLVNAAQGSVGVDYGVDAARYKLQLLLDELELIDRQLSQIEEEMAIRCALTIHGRSAAWPDTTWLRIAPVKTRVEPAYPNVAEKVCAACFTRWR